MSFAAKYPGECSTCFSPFDEGDEIEYNALNEIIGSECCGEGDSADALDFDPEEPGYAEDSLKW